MYLKITQNCDLFFLIKIIILKTYLEILYLTQISNLLTSNPELSSPPFVFLVPMLDSTLRMKTNMGLISCVKVPLPWHWEPIRKCAMKGGGVKGRLEFLKKVTLGMNYYSVWAMLARHKDKSEKCCAELLLFFFHLFTKTKSIPQKTLFTIIFFF